MIDSGNSGVSFCSECEHLKPAEIQLPLNNTLNPDRILVSSTSFSGVKRTLIVPIKTIYLFCVIAFGFICEKKSFISLRVYGKISVLNFL